MEFELKKSGFQSRSPCFSPPTAATTSGETSESKSVSCDFFPERKSLNLTRVCKTVTGAAEGDTKKNNEVLDPRETIQAVAWMDMMFQDSGYTREKANEAATIIQASY